MFLIKISICNILCLYIIFSFLRLHLWHMEVPSLGVELELQPQAYATATEIPVPSHICDQHCGLQQASILNPLSEARDRGTAGTPNYVIFIICVLTIIINMTQSVPSIKKKFHIPCFHKTIIVLVNIYKYMYTHIYTHIIYLFIKV